MTNAVMPPPPTAFSDPFAHKSGGRPPPLRTNSVQIEQPDSDARREGTHIRHQSTSTARPIARLALRSREQLPASHPQRLFTNHSAYDKAGLSTLPLLPLTKASTEHHARSGLPSPPVTPVKAVMGEERLHGPDQPQIMAIDLSRINYELGRAKLLGTGLWSKVFLAEPVIASPRQPKTRPLSPPVTPFKADETPTTNVFAVKVPLRPDARAVLVHEAKILTHLQRRPGTSQYLVPFLGLDERNGALVSEAVIGGSLEHLTNRLRHMTEVARHLELVSIFPGLAFDLVSGLDFIHAAGIVHADIKPANIVLDISDYYSLPAPVIRARYIDFSAAFPADDVGAATNAGGTWDFMAPEQLRTQKHLSTPTFASDAWSLGITLLSVIVGGSPYTAACGRNVFMLREAVKTGDPLGFARMDPVTQKRMAAVQDFIDCCKLALHKDRDRRSSAHAWRSWLVSQELGDGEVV